MAAPILDGRPQLLTAAYRHLSLAPLEAAFQGGERAVRRAVAGAGLTVVATAPLDPARLTDADTPADLARLGRQAVTAPRPGP